jgi:hypothetical protein
MRRRDTREAALARWTDADLAVRLGRIGRSPRWGVTELIQYQIVVV